MEEHFEKKISKWESGGTLAIDLQLEYSPLVPIDVSSKELEDSMQAIQDGKFILAIEYCHNF